MKLKEEIEQFLTQAVKDKVSDIFFLPKDDHYQLLFRNNLGLSLYKNLMMTEASDFINYMKYAAQMDIAEHRRPQVGAMIFYNNGQQYFLRLSCLGDFNGEESLVVRIIYQLDKSLYFYPKQFEQMRRLSQNRGLIVTSGPTGSGKTTTMYELAKQIGKNKIVMTIEDPVEIKESNFLQTQVNTKAAIDYQSLLKAALRHRPDILIVGEIRDKGTARLAVDAALSGHLVLATVHAKSTLQTISRLEGLGIRRDELENCLTAVSYQRLLPAGDKIKCLIDLAAASELNERSDSEQRTNFISWQENLKKLYQEGEIDECVFEQFQQG